MGAVYAEPGGEGNEVVVGRRELGLAGDVAGDEVVLLLVAGGDVDIGDIEKTLDCAVEGVGVCRRQGGDVLSYSRLVCYLALLVRSRQSDTQLGGL